MDTLDDALQGAGLGISASELTLDNEYYGIEIDDKKWRYIGSVGGGYFCVTMWDWKGEKHVFKREPHDKRSAAYKEFDKKSREAAITAERERKKGWETASVDANGKWGGMESLDIVSPYLKDKKIVEYYDKWMNGGPVHGAKIIREKKSDVIDLIIPMHDHDGKMWGYQMINEAGKFFKDGQKIDGCYALIGKLEPKGVIYICEGFATALTVWGATGKTCAVAFSAGNFALVGEGFRRNCPELRLVFCGDNDQWKRRSDGGLYRTGYKAACEAATRTQGSVCTVSFENRDVSTKPTDFNDLLLLSDAAEVARQIDSHHATTPVEFIPTEYTGFHSEELTQRGVTYKARPDHLSKFYGREHRFVTLAQGKAPYTYEKGVYKDVPPAFLEKFAEDHFTLKDGEEHNCDNKMASEFLGKLQRSNVRPVEWFYESTEGMINFKNGYLDTTGKELEFTERDSDGRGSEDRGFRTMLDYEYDPKAEAPHWKDALFRVMGGYAIPDGVDEKKKQELLARVYEKMNCIEEFIGYTLSNDSYWMHHALIFVGDGENGKSTIMDVVRQLLGEGNTCSVPLGDLNKEYSLQLLDGALACITEENSQKKNTLDASQAFKSLSDGGVVTARSPYQKPYQFRNRAKFIFAYNKFDRIPETGHALKRRLIVIPFDVTFKKGDPNRDSGIKERLLGELPGIFNRCVAAYQRCKVRGSITWPKQSQEMIDELAIESDSVALFVKECCEIVNGEWKEPKSKAEKPDWADWDTKGPFVYGTDVFSAYCTWADSGRYEAVRHVEFGRRLRKMVEEQLGQKMETERVRWNGKRQYLVRGVTFVDGGNV